MVDQNQSKRSMQLLAWTDAMREELGDHRPRLNKSLWNAT
jgi:hypothetical protein